MGHCCQTLEFNLTLSDSKRTFLMKTNGVAKLYLSSNRSLQTIVTSLQSGNN